MPTLKDCRQFSKAYSGKKKNNFSVALLNKNPGEEKSLSKKLDEIDRLKNKIVREADAKMTDFAIQHLRVAKYYDAKNGQQLQQHPPPKANASSCLLPSLTGNAPRRKKSCFQERRADCATFRSRCCSGLLSRESEETPDKGKPGIRSDTNDFKNDYVAPSSRPRNRRSLSFCVASSSSLPVKLDQDLKRSQGRDLKGATCTVGDSDSFEPQEHFFSPRNDPVTTERRRRTLKRGVTVGSAPETSVFEEIGRWQQSTRLVKDLPKSKQVEIIRGACFLRMGWASVGAKHARARTMSTLSSP